MKNGVKAVPEGCHTITPHLVIRDAGRAIEFYKQVFGARELMRMPGPDGKSVGHCELRIGDSRLFLCDECPQWGALSAQALNGSGVTINLYLDDADAVFNKAVAAGAKVQMPMTDAFWGDRYGKIVDPFGHHWALATHIEDLSPEEIHKRGQAVMAQMAGSHK